MMDDLPSSDRSYIINFRNCQFSQSNVQDTKLKKRYKATAMKSRESDVKKKLNVFKDTECLLLDSSSTFSCCNNPKMLVSLKKGKC